MDNFFTGVPLAKTLLQHQLTFVGTMKCKREIPECMKVAKSQKTKSLVFSFNNNMKIVNYVPKKNKAVKRLRTMYHNISIYEEDPKKRPEIIKFYNKTKIAVDLVDQMVQTYTCKRQTNQWPLIFFYNLLDIAALNSYTIFRQVYLDYQNGHSSRRRRFLTDLAESLIMPHMTSRQQPVHLTRATLFVIDTTKCNNFL